MRKVETLAERYILLGSLLFMLITEPQKESAVLAAPESCADAIITLYHLGIIKHISLFQTNFSFQISYIIHEPL